MLGQLEGVDRASLRLAAMTLPARRRMLRARWRLRTLTRGPIRAGLADRLEWALRLPRSEALRLDAEIAFQDKLTGLEWLAVLTEHVDAIRVDCACSVLIEGREHLSRVAETGRPVVLAPLHMGNYVHGIAWTMLSHFADRPLLVLYKRDDLQMQAKTIGRIRQLGISLRMVQIDDRAAFLPSMRAVKKDAAVIVAFADLPGSYGSPADVEIFQRPMSLAVGVDALARLTDALVVPMANEVRLDGDRLHFGRPFDSHDGSASERARVIEIMRRHVETAILHRPEQWHLWARLEEYARDDRSAGEAGIETAA